MKISKGTIIRTLCLILALTNQILVAAGKNPLPVSESEMYEGITVAFTVCTSLISWWKNNSFTKRAIYADEVMKNGC